MCSTADSRPPIPPIMGGALDTMELTLTSEDGARFTAFMARAARPSGTGVVVLPDVRGLQAYYEELALRFAEHGMDAIAIDYFGRTAGLGRREADFEHIPHDTQLTFAGMSADLRTALAALRVEAPAVERLFTIGFCRGGRLAFLATTLELDLSGAIGFYGWPVGTRNDLPAPAAVADHMAAPVLAIFGGADSGISAADVSTFDTALEGAGATHRIVTYPDAPHGFFDREMDEFALTSEQAWGEVLAFIRNPQAARD